MKSTLLLVISLLLISIFSISTASKTENNSTNKKASKYYYKHILALQQEANTLNDLCSDAKTKSDVNELQKQLVKTRLAYKRVEFILDYLHSAYNKKYLNGGPIPKFNEETTKVIPSNGLQTLDELIFSDEAFENLVEITSLARDFKKDLQLITDSDKGVQLRDIQIIEALRSGSVRIFALGVSGFDTPGSVNGLEESRVSLMAMDSVFSTYKNNLVADAKKAYKNVKKLLKKGQKQLESNPDFDSFNRLDFLTDVINPLYAAFYDFQIKNGITTERSFYHAQNYTSTNLFNENFLDTNHYSQFSYLPLDNLATIELGKKLFYDKQLSNNETMSCATCHDPKQGFADGLPKSKTNLSNVFTQRNSPGLIDAAYASRYFWDLREYDLERQVNHVVENNLEFNIDFNVIEQRLKSDSFYRQMFDSCYGGISKQNINHRSISNAIAAYVNSLTSFNSEFDKYVRHEIEQYPEDAEAGFNLFMGKAACATCHFVPAFNGTVPPFYTETESEVLGITVGLDTINPILDNDLGRMQNELGKEDLAMFKRSFKTVTVRNVELTAPYMHNGSFKTLDDVIEFYNRGGGAGMGLAVDNQTLSSEPLSLSTKEKKQLIAFMKTLTDTSGLTNPKLTWKPKVYKD